MIIKIISHPPLASIFLMSSIKTASFLLKFFNYSSVLPWPKIPPPQSNKKITTRIKINQRPLELLSRFKSIF
jgi:hypothetical protein